jgi:predicted transcriptional regulator
MGKVIKMDDLAVMGSNEGYVRVDNLYIKDYFSMPLFQKTKVEHGKSLFDIALMFRYWVETDCIKTTVSAIAELIDMNRRTIDKYIKSDLEAFVCGKRCQVYDFERVGKSIKLKIKHKPAKKYYTAVPMKVIRSNILTPLEKKVYMVILFYSNNDDGVAWASRTTIAQLCGCEKSSVTNAVKGLEKVGVLSCITFQKSNGQSKNFYKPLLVVKNNSIETLKSDIYVSPSNVNKAIKVYIAIGEKSEQEEYDKQIPEKNNELDDVFY